MAGCYANLISCWHRVGLGYFVDAHSAQDVSNDIMGASGVKDSGKSENGIRYCQSIQMSYLTSERYIISLIGALT